MISLLSKPSSNVEAIANAISHDQAFATRILRVANSAYYQRREEKITSIPQAILRVGYNTVRDIAITAEFAELVQKRLPSAVNLRHLLAKTAVATHQAAALAHEMRLPAEAVYTSTLLESLGEFAIAVYLPNIYLKVWQTVDLTGKPYDDAHLQVTGMTLHEVTVQVANTLQLPEELILPPPSTDNPADWTATDRRQAVVHLATTCATNVFGPESPLIVTQFQNMMEVFTKASGLPLPEIESLMAEAFSKAMAFGSHIDLDRSCFALDGNTSPLSMRHAFIGICIERAERDFGIGSAFARG